MYLSLYLLLIYVYLECFEVLDKVTDHENGVAPTNR